ncbi:MAG: 2-oxoacid:acceptor oxidoreductase family protein, partial [Thermoplasmatota archaeon]
IINSSRSPEAFDFGGAEVYTVDATSIAVSNGLGTETNPIVNTAILGAYSRVVGNVDMESIYAAIEQNVPVKHQQNKQAAREAYEQVRGVAA